MENQPQHILFTAIDHYIIGPDPTLPVGVHQTNRLRERSTNCTPLHAFPSNCTLNKQASSYNDSRCALDTQIKRILCKMPSSKVINYNSKLDHNESIGERRHSCPPRQI